jgi:hypothetical protein
MVMKARDERDTIAHNLRFHHGLGIDHFVVADLGSTDGTADELDRWEATGLLTRRTFEGTYHTEARSWMEQMARYAATELGADWIVHADPDEFVLPASGTIPSELEAIDAEDGAVVVPRSNLLPTADAEGAFYERMVLRERRSTLGPKLAHRATADVVVFDKGAHLVATERDAHRWARPERAALKGGRRPSPFSPPPLAMSWSEEVPLRMYHYPARSPEQLAKRIAIELEQPGNPDRPGLRKRIEAGEAARIYEELVPGERQVADALSGGTLIRDTRVRDVLARCRDPVANGVSPGYVAIRPAPEELDAERKERRKDVMAALARGRYTLERRYRLAREDAEQTHRRPT